MEKLFELAKKLSMKIVNDSSSKATKACQKSNDTYMKRI